MQNNESTLKQSNQGNPLERVLNAENSPPVLSRFGKYVVDTSLQFGDYLSSHLPAGLSVGLGLVAAYGALAFWGGNKSNATPLFETLVYEPDAGEAGIWEFQVSNIANKTKPNDPEYTEIIIHSAELILFGEDPASGWNMDLGPPFRLFTNGDGIDPGDPPLPFTLLLNLGTQEGTSPAHVGGEAPWKGIDVPCVTASRSETPLGDYDGNGSVGTPEDCQALADCLVDPEKTMTQFCLDGGDTDFDCQIDYFDPACDAKAIPTTSEWGLVITNQSIKY